MTIDRPSKALKLKSFRNESPMLSEECSNVFISRALDFPVQPGTYSFLVL